MFEFYKSTFPIAKKTHYCESCGKQIEVGEKYSYESGVFDGFFTRKLCLPCKKMLEWYICSRQEEEFEWFGVSDDLRDEYCSKCTFANWKECIHSTCPQRCEYIRKTFENNTRKDDDK